MLGYYFIYILLFIFASFEWNTNWLVFAHQSLKEVGLELCDQGVTMTPCGD